MISLAHLIFHDSTSAYVAQALKWQPPNIIVILLSQSI